MDDGLWTVWTATKSVPAHTAHSPYDDGVALFSIIKWPCFRLTKTHSPDGGDEVGTFSTVKWVLFQLSRFRLNGSGGYFFDCQMGTFSLDKNTFAAPPLCITELQLKDGLAIIDKAFEITDVVAGYGK